MLAHPATKASYPQVLRVLNFRVSKIPVGLPVAAFSPVVETQHMLLVRGILQGAAHGDDLDGVLPHLRGGQQQGWERAC
jgi:hypothetical protein